MRTAFIETLIELARKDGRILLLTGDLGYTVLEPFAEAFPDRFFNVGVAEQNMVGMATGLAEAGFIPFVYSIATFASLRPYEFIRNGPILHQLPVRIIGVGGGFDYSNAGLSHYGLEDVGVMRIQKGITTVVPTDYCQVKDALNSTWDLPQPVYYRLGKSHKAQILPQGNFQLGKINKLKEGKECLFVTMGSITEEVLGAVEILAQQNISASVVAVASFNPSPEEELARILKDFQMVFAVEDHYVTGGIGSFVCEVAAQNGLSCRVERCGVSSSVNGITGSKKYMYNEYALSADCLAEKAVRLIKERK